LNSGTRAAPLFDRTSIGHRLAANVIRPAHLLILASLLATACRPTGKTPTIADAGTSIVPSASGSAAPAASAKAPVADAGYVAALTLLASGSNALGLEVYGVARKTQGNVALSPLSLSMALTMTWAGARGDTAAEMKTVLHTEAAQDKALDAEAVLLAWVRDPAQAVTLRIANRLFGEKTYAFNPTYVDQVNSALGAGFEPLDFIGAAEGSRHHINDWVATQTDQHIKDLLPPRGVTSDTRLVLANAIYFLGQWAHPFRAEETKPAPFHASGSNAESVPTMHELEHLRFAHTDGVQVLEIPYTGGQLAMTFVLPDAMEGLDAVESRLSPAIVTSWLGALALTRVRVSMPRFEISPADPLALKGILSSLGMPLAFDHLKADFTGIGSSPRADDRLFLSDVFHKAFVKVDESGTEAAAATGGAMRRPTFILREPPPVAFTADHPFLFFLTDVGSGAILFMGRVKSPVDHTPT
jgi:serpin B